MYGVINIYVIICYTRFDLKIIPALVFSGFFFPKQEIEEDKKMAEKEGIAVTTGRKPRPQEPESERRKTEKENFTVTVDLSKPAGVRRTAGDEENPDGSCCFLCFHSAPSDLFMRTFKPKSEKPVASFLLSGRSSFPITLSTLSD